MRSFENALNISQRHLLYFFRCKKNLVEYILLYVFDIEISTAVIYDIIDIDELGGFTRGSSFFYFTESCVLVFHLLFSWLFVIYDKLPNTSYSFELLYWLLRECLSWRFLIKNIEGNINGYLLLCSGSNTDLFWKRFKSISIQVFLPKWIRFLHFRLSN